MSTLDFGLVLSTRLYIKDMSLKTSSISAGDVILKINNTPTDGMSVKEARRLIEATKDKLQLVIKREETGGQREEQKAYSTQNLYVQPPRRAEFSGGGGGGGTGQRDYVPPRPPPPQEDEGKALHLSYEQG
jgi:C-terminal processing protease CtpA/Prc